MMDVIKLIVCIVDIDFVGFVGMAGQRNVDSISVGWLSKRKVETNNLRIIFCSNQIPYNCKFNNNQILLLIAKYRKLNFKMMLKCRILFKLQILKKKQNMIMMIMMMKI